MLRVVWAEMRHRWSRTLALLAGIVVATTSFAVLTGTAVTERLQVRETVARSFRGSYDVLVRPRGSRTRREVRTGSVQPNFLSGLFGGISVRQWRKIQSLPGVVVAAPLANIGYVMPTAEPSVRLPAGTGRRRALVRGDVSWRSERGLTDVPDAPSFAYVTPHALLRGPGQSNADPYARYALRERTGGRTAPVCYWGFDLDALAFPGPFSPSQRSQFGCFSQENGMGQWFNNDTAFRRMSPRIVLRWSFPLLLTAIDPASEARLTGLDRSVIAGRYLRGGEHARVRRWVPRWQLPGRFLPVLAANRTYLDEQVEVSLRPLRPGAVERWTRPFAVRTDTLTPLRFLLHAPARPVEQRIGVPAAVAYRQLLRELRDPGAYAPQEVSALWRVGPTSYRAGAGPLRPRTRSADPTVWQDYVSRHWAFPSPSAGDVQARRIDRFVDSGATDSNLAPTLNAVGVFDPGRLGAAPAPGSAPLGTLQAPSLAPRDATTRRRLGGRPLRPNSNLGGYLAQPPALLTTIQAVRDFGAFPGLDLRRPISAIRVRVAGVTGVDPVSRERIRQAAQRIATTTGLDVDITAGASGAPMALDLPPGRFGRPPLALTEPWIRKGVATQILDAIDRKSLMLFALILVVCTLFVTNASSAAVRARRSELGVLAAIGWPTKRLFAVVLLEVGATGFAAGVVGGLLAVPLAAAAGVSASLLRDVLAVAAATTLALLAGLVPALRAARASPMAAMQPVVLDTARAWRPRTLGALALVNVARAPGRTALAAVTLAIGVCALTLLVSVTLAFHDTLVGTLLGDAVAVQVTGGDYAAVVATMLLAVATVADVLYLEVRERAAELGIMRATGWDETKLRRLIALEGGCIGLLGGGAGGVAGLTAAGLFAHAVPIALVLVAAGAALAGASLAAFAALAPAAWLRRAPLMPLLAGE
jgi:hypothetical protein